MKIVSSAMLVDDERFDLVLCERILQRSGRFPYTFRARTGDQALEMFLDPVGSRRAHPGRFPPRLVLLDINMPRMSGFEFLDALIAARAGTAGAEPLPAVVMLSSSEDPVDRARVASYPCVLDYRVKPLLMADAIGLAERFGRG